MRRWYQLSYEILDKIIIIYYYIIFFGVCVFFFFFFFFIESFIVHLYGSVVLHSKGLQPHLKSNFGSKIMHVALEVIFVKKLTPIWAVFL